METLIDTFGEGRLMLATGIAVGALFGFAAYRSSFCLRAATIEVAEGRAGSKLALWLIAFTTALACVQIAIAAGQLDVSAARQLAATGSFSGAIIGGVLFGVGMVLARGCASRLLVLSASGNLRAIVTGLVLTLVAQASLRGVLAPPREYLASLWTVAGGEGRYLISADLISGPVAILFFSALVAAAVAFGLRHSTKRTDMVYAALVGIAVYLGWQVTYLIAQASFEIVAVPVPERIAQCHHPHTRFHQSPSQQELLI